MELSFLTNKETKILTMGVTNKITGKATTKAKPQASNQINIIFSTNPKLKRLMTNDMIPDINNAIINEKTRP
jgi:hypothetical protein